MGYSPRDQKESDTTELAYTLWRTVWGFLKKLKTDLPYDPASHSWTYIKKRQKL